MLLIYRLTKKPKKLLRWVKATENILKVYLNTIVPGLILYFK